VVCKSVIMISYWFQSGSHEDRRRCQSARGRTWASPSILVRQRQPQNDKADQEVGTYVWCISQFEQRIKHRVKVPKIEGRCDADFFDKCVWCVTKRKKEEEEKKKTSAYICTKPAAPPRAPVLSYQQHPNGFGGITQLGSARSLPSFLPVEVFFSTEQKKNKQTNSKIISCNRPNFSKWG
jgi:hypothetical protein